MLRALLLSVAFAGFVSATGSKKAPKVEVEEVISGDKKGGREVEAAAAIPVIPVDEPVALGKEEGDSKKQGSKKKNAKKVHAKKKTKHELRSARKGHRKHRGARHRGNHECGNRISDELNAAAANHTAPHIVSCDPAVKQHAAHPHPHHRHAAKHAVKDAAVAAPKSAEDQAVKDTEKNISEAKKEVQALKDLPKETA